MITYFKKIEGIGLYYFLMLRCGTGGEIPIFSTFCPFVIMIMNMIKFYVSRHRKPPKKYYKSREAPRFLHNFQLLFEIFLNSLFSHSRACFHSRVTLGHVTFRHASLCCIVTLNFFLKLPTIVLTYARFSFMLAIPLFAWVPSLLLVLFSVVQL
jgi:hypothetical protein